MGERNYNTEQEKFWVGDYASTYRENNCYFDEASGVDAWNIMLSSPKNINSVLECGSNIGRNIGFLNSVLPNAKKSIIEINSEAFQVITNKYDIEHAYNGSIINSAFDENKFDLVFTMGVLIHIHPDNLLENMNKIFNYSGKYVLIGEYFNRTPVMLEYHGQSERLFKRDFGRMFIENFSVRIIDYGFLWGWFYDDAGFDDITWWLFEKDI